VLFVDQPGPTTAQVQEASRRHELRPDQAASPAADAAADVPGAAVPWLDRRSHREFLAEEATSLLVFGSESVREDGGFGWLDEDGELDLSRPAELWITCRMTHCFALGHLMGRPDFGRFADHGIAALNGVFRDREHGGWFSAVADGKVVDDSKQA